MNGAYISSISCVAVSSVSSCLTLIVGREIHVSNDTPQNFAPVLVARK